MNEKRQAIRELLNAIGERYWEHNLKSRLQLVKVVVYRAKQKAKRYDYKYERGLA